MYLPNPPFYWSKKELRNNSTVSKVLADLTFLLVTNSDGQQERDLAISVRTSTFHILLYYVFVLLLYKPANAVYKVSNILDF